MREIKVAVRIHPLLEKEVVRNHQVCVWVGPGSSQVIFGSDRVFSFDHVFGSTASQDSVYESCIQPLVESLVDGYNATIFCYGQTGSGRGYSATLISGAVQGETPGLARAAHHSQSASCQRVCEVLHGGQAGTNDFLRNYDCLLEFIPVLFGC
uniref:Kinesin motor domain-containing protein n=1 Tax=Monopterus albus TaxID=43700 RepID=A0A3Q3JZP4_MONAL